MKFSKLTPNLIVRNLEGSIAFYRDVLGFQLALHVPDAPPFIFAGMVGDGVEIFLNQFDPAQTAAPAGQLGGVFLSLYVELQGVQDLLRRVEAKGVKVVTPLHDEFYGMREFAIDDPDGYRLIFAERIGS